MVSLKLVYWVSLLVLMAPSALAQPVAIPFAPVSADGTQLFNAAVRVDDGWVAVGNSGRIATIRQGITTYYPSPARENWQFVWVSATGELFVATEHSKPTVAVRLRDGSWMPSNLTECTFVRSLLGNSANTVWLACSENRLFRWDGSSWLSVPELSDVGDWPKLIPLGNTLGLLGAKAAWQLATDRTSQLPSLNGFTSAAGKAGVPEWGIRNDEVFRIRGRTIQHFGHAPAESTIIADKNGVVVAANTSIMRVSGNRLVRLGPNHYDFTWVGVAPNAAGAVVLTAFGKELNLEQARQLTGPHQSALEIETAQDAGKFVPNVIGCELTALAQPDEVDNSRSQDLGVPLVRRHIFFRSNERYALTYRGDEFQTIDGFDGQSWKTLVGPEITSTWQGAPQSIGGGREPNSDLWFAGCGYLVHRAGGKLTRHVLGRKACLNGFFQGVKDAFFFGDGPYVLRRQANEWIAEPSPGGIRAMCEKDGRVFAVTDQSPQGLFVRRDRGYWAHVSSDASWQAAVAGREFGHVSGLAGALDDGYLLVAGRIEHYDGHTFTELHTDSGLGLRAIGYAGGWALGLGEDGFVYSRNRGAAGNHFARGPHLEGTSVFVESPNLATVASAHAIYHFDGKNWSKQTVVARDAKTKQDRNGVVGFARWHGQLMAFEASGLVRAFVGSRWIISGVTEQIPRVPPSEFQSGDAESMTGSSGSKFSPCAVLQPTPETYLLVSCTAHLIATFHEGKWSSYPLADEVSPSVGCVTGDACYILNPSYPLRAKFTAF